MTKVSSNAGKHPYLRPDHGFLFDHLKIDKNGRKFDTNVEVRIKQRISTDYFDSNKVEIFYGDTVTYREVEYLVTYDTREYCWTMENILQPEKRKKLKETAHLTVLGKKRN
jgi:hypothetical protein